MNSIDGKTNVIRSDKSNYILLILDYKLELDKNKNISKYFTNDKDFFNSFLKIEYKYNNKTKLINSLNIESVMNDKVFVSIPYELNNADSIYAVLSFRDTQVKIKLK